MLLAGLAAGCDNISEEDRYIKVEKPVVENPRNLLIMEFTGNNCMNCPNGAAIVDDIKKEEGDNEYGQPRVISVGLHPYGNVNTDPVISKYPKPGTMQDLRCDAATALYDYYKPSGFPSAVFNGLNMSGSMGDWQTRASEALQASSKVSIAALAGYDSETRELTVRYDLKFGNVISEPLSIMVWLVESHIPGTQTMPDGKKNFDYEHNHVLRASLNGDWGEAIGSSFDSDSEVDGSASIVLKDEWKAENCHVVVYVYRDGNKEVEQAVQIPVI